MYAFRKPFTAATYEGQEVFGLGLKTVLVISQLAGYMLSKFIGIKVVSEMRSEWRAAAIVGLIVVAEAALIGFALVPVQLKVLMLFLNGLPLGMVFGLVLAYLEGRRQTEALSAALCASFIISSGVVKSIGRWLVQDWGVSEFHMPMWTGLIFLPALLVSVMVLRGTPPPDAGDTRLRSERKAMDRAKRKRFLSAYWPGLGLLVFVYVALTVVRTIRDDFGVEIWRDMGIDETPSVFATSEMAVAVFVTALNGLAMWIRHNITALRATFGLNTFSFGLVGLSVILQQLGAISPFVFMVACGIGLYVPYVAFHTTIFERLIAVSRHPGNLGFLMYVADATGYLGYAAVMVGRTKLDPGSAVLPFFRGVLLIVVIASVIAMFGSWLYFQRKLGLEQSAVPAESTVLAESTPPAEPSAPLVAEVDPAGP